MRIWHIYAFIGAVSLLLFATAGLAVRSGTARSWMYRSTHSRATEPEAFWSQVVADACFGAMLLFGIFWSGFTNGFSQ